ncbi:MAG: alpha/beta hydrolase [Thermoanaerobaculia bacterium]
MRPLMLAMVLICAASLQAAGAENVAPLSIGETFTVQSEILGEVRRINVYCPPIYTSSPEIRLPVLVMPDGGVAEDFIHVMGLIQVSVGNDTMRPFILVGIENTQRRRDMTGPTENAEDKKIAPRVGGSQAFRSFIRTELMPVIKARYRTTDESAIVGESLAGLFVIETLLTEPDLFDTYIALDPSLWWNDEGLIRDAAKGLRRIAQTGRVRTLYFASSNEPGMIAGAGKLEKALRTSGPVNLKWHYEKMPDESHATIYHPGALKAFRAVFGRPHS